jgi:hypothetical protein
MRFRTFREGIALSPEGEQGAVSDTAGAASGAASQAPQADAAAAAAPVRPEGLADAYWDAKAGVKVDALLKDHLALSKSAADRAAALATKPEDYEIPATVKVGETEVALKADDPLMADARKLALEAGVPKAEFPKFLALHAKAVVAANAAAEAETDRIITEQRALLGANVDQREAAIKQAFEARAGAGAFEHLRGALVTKVAFEAMERFIEGALRGSATAFNQLGRQESAAARISDDEWNRMTPRERITWSRENKAA